MTTILIFIAVLALLIFVHEFGHYITAVRNGVTAHEFGFGFPPRIVGIVKNDKGKWEIVWRTQKKKYKNTIFSLNWIPLGGFVRIKGEDGTSKDPDSFAAQSAWVRFKILVAGVVMNVITAFLLFAVALSFGMPEPVPDGTPHSFVQITRVQTTGANAHSPATEMGLKMGDILLKACADNGCAPITGSAMFIEFTSAHKGQEVEITVRRGGKEITTKGVLRGGENADKNGALGIELANVRIADLNNLEIIGGAAYQTWTYLVLITTGLAELFWNLLTGAGLSADVAGPVGIAKMTGEVAALGLAQLAHFAAILSVNLAIINILPLPALDGGRIFFILIEKLRGGKPVNKNVESVVHGISFVALIILMAIITVRDILHLF